MEKKETITDRIRYVMEHDGHTVATFARKIGVPDQTIRNYSSGTRTPNYDLIVKILAATPWIDANWLVMGQEAPDTQSEVRKLIDIVDKQQDTIQMLTRQIVRLKELLPGAGDGTPACPSLSDTESKLTSAF